MTYKRRNLRCRLQLREDLPESHLVNYFQALGTQQKNELILKAMKAFWLPLALESAQVYTSTQVVNFYLDAIEQLKCQILYLQQLVRLNHNDSVELFNLISASDQRNPLISDELSSELLEEDDALGSFLTDSTGDYTRSSFGF